MQSSSFSSSALLTGFCAAGGDGGGGHAVQCETVVFSFCLPFGTEVRWIRLEEEETSEYFRFFWKEGVVVDEGGW